MLVILSPSKTINTNFPVRGRSTIPAFLYKSEKLIANLKHLWLKI